MYQPGRLCMKIAGRDAGRYCLVVDEKDGRILIDGQTRRRYVNPTHIEPLKKKADIKKGASTADVIKALEGFDIEVQKEQKTSKKSTAKPKKEEE